MKKLIFGLLAIVITVTTYGFENDSTNVVEKSKGKAEIQVSSVSTEWTIGRKSRNCRRFGICKLKKVTITIADIEDVPSDEGDFYGKISNNGNGQIKVVVNQKNMERIIAAFGKESLIMEEDFAIEDQDLLKDLNLSSFTIKTGEYNFVLNKSTSQYELVL